MNNLSRKLCILNTRAATQAASLSLLLKDVGAEPYEFPTLQVNAVQGGIFVELGNLLSHATSSDWMLFTSANAVSAVCTSLDENHKSFLSKLKIAVIGEKTAKAVREYGLAVNFISKTSVSEVFGEEFVEHLKSEKLNPSLILILRALKATSLLPELLVNAGLNIKSYAVYDSVLPVALATELQMLVSALKLCNQEDESESINKSKCIDALIFTSSFAARNLFEVIERHKGMLLNNWKNVLTSYPVFVIGPKTASTVKQLGFKTIVCSEISSIESLVSAITKHYARTGFL